jgi:hypothetical protein
VGTGIGEGQLMIGDGLKARLADTSRSIVFFGLLYVYLWRAVEPHLIYGCGTITNFPVFYKGGEFFWECLSYPGGLLRYVCALLPQFFYYSWAGALVITAQAWALCACTGWFLRMLEVPGRRLLRFIPPVVVLVAYARYSYHFPTITGALASVLFGCLYIGISSHPSRSTRPWLREGAVYVLLSVVSYVVGAAAYLPFAVLCAVYELLYRRRYGMSLAYLLLAAILPYVMGVLVFHVSIVNAYTDMLPLSWQIRNWATRGKMAEAVYVLYLFPVAAALLWGLLRGTVWNKLVGWALNPRVTRASAKQTRGLKTHPTHWLRGPVVRGSVASVLLFASAGGVAFFSLDRQQKALLAVHYYACHRMWPEILQTSWRCSDNYPVMNAVNRALYYTGRLDRDMFGYLQHPEALVVTGENHSMVYWHKFDTLMDLGLVNLAEKNLTECMETFGEQPMILQRLALANLAKGKVEAARIFLERLQKTLFFSRWANDYLTRLAADPTLAADAEMQQLRARLLRKDSAVAFFATEPMLAALVEQGNQNRMAFQYLMSWYMMNKRLDKFGQNLKRLPEFGYTEIPPLYQEAALIASTRHPIPLGDFAVSAQAQQRMKHFGDVFNRYGRNKEAAFSELAKEYATSYFFYFIYADAPAGK